MSEEEKDKCAYPIKLEFLDRWICSGFYDFAKSSCESDEVCKEIVRRYNGYAALAAENKRLKEALERAYPMLKGLADKSPEGDREANIVFETVKQALGGEK